MDTNIPTTPIIRTRRTEADDPRRLGVWKLGRVLGQGISGRVRIARNARNGTMAAIKIIPKTHLHTRADSLDRAAEEAEQTELALQREIVCLKLVDHPNVMKLYDVWDTPNDLYLVLEYVQGGELFDFLCERKHLEPLEALGYFQQIIAGIDYCHAFGIAHRDLKPENILLDQDHNVKIADFGLAALHFGDMLSTSCGSPHYAAPEVINGVKYDGAAADIWSCGVILFALLTGRLPFEDDSTGHLLAKITAAKYEMPKDIPVLAQDLLRRMLMLDVKKRITMRQIKHHPFFNSPPPKANYIAPPKLEDIALPIEEKDIDEDLFESLQLLWKTTPRLELVTRLSSEERNWQKGVYHLLEKYRQRTMEDYDEQAEIDREAKLIRKKETEIARRQLRQEDSPNNVTPSPSSIPPRASPPTPRRASGARRVSLPSMMTEERTWDPSSPLSSLINSPPTTAPPDNILQTFFHQSVFNEHEGRHAIGSPTVAQINDILSMPTMFGDSPNQLHDLALFPPGEERFEDHGLSIRPLGVRSKDRPRRKTTDGLPFHSKKGDKENIDEGYMLINRLTQVVKKSSMKKGGKNREASGGSEKKVQIQEPKRARSRLRKQRSRSSTGPESSIYSPDPSSPSSPSPSQLGSWFANVFKFKPTSSVLQSMHDVQTTLNECRRLLMGMDVRVALEEGEEMGVLKCRLDELRDPSGMMSALKPVKFRVEAHASDEPGWIALLLVQEKGSTDSFKEIFKQVKDQWVMDEVGCRTPDAVMMLSPPMGSRARVF